MTEKDKQENYIEYLISKIPFENETPLTFEQFIKSLEADQKD